MNTQITSSLYDQCIATYNTEQKEGTLAAIRKQAFTSFQKNGFPSTKVEDWKYTNLKPFIQDNLQLVYGETSTALTKEIIESALIPGLDAYIVVLVNGQLQKTLSHQINEKGFTLLPILEATELPAFQQHFGKYTDVTKHHLTAVNTALFKDGLFVHLTKSQVVEKPIHIIHVSTAKTDFFTQPRYLYVVEENARLKVVETYITTTQVKAVVNQLTEVFVGKSANFQQYNIQTGDANAHFIQHTEVFQETTSVYNNYKFSMPGISFLRNNLHIALDGEHIESHMYGLYLSGGAQLVDNHTIVDHRKPNCQSNEHYKGVMQDASTGVFNGKIFVQEDAQKTNAFQQNNNLILGDKASVNSKPQLEIFADDVKCSHGSTIGQFNNEALFYLKTRGIGDEKAKTLLVQAFAFDVTDKIPDESIQDFVNGLIEEGLK
ncbi:Fe-S cluster assembly protein SufD [Gynurincola endophyticus]|uniref:Fe-S cluster assembly protein SufD n=1 Tax=Gynurincola endophyticus TaxID=2479004 RepID=UPI000F8C3109|nr:Fe-S cluster assembly protein SufD [Gynurincola endophyticus]